ncbi:VTT domain-containing protein [Streptomyces sp. DSM 44917]|uniref:VTT domain-containing protein n=1 Tax=Streptomyces boetiae TaxID=3075541 RepID=A0ABU2L3H9_9ACTN|nr:VTT domain-containing protein [Streptomyces sp. DSM 44917]MDT0306072.1 VTT domain-containing protein [Streptomyces sp. DSM 44917]
MQETLGILLYAPWIYVIIALSILLDVFVPVLPSGALVVTAATVAAGTAADVAGLPSPDADTHLPQLFLLVLCATTASVAGDLLAYRLALRGGPRFSRVIARSRRLAAAQARVETALARGGGPLVVLARFAPAGRAVVSLGAGVARRRARDFLPWSAVAAVAWTAYSVGIGYLGGQLLGASWISTGLSLLALLAAGVVAARLLRPATAAEAPAAPPAGAPAAESLPTT